MKLGNYVVLMVVGIVAMVLMPLAPCEADWEWTGGSRSHEDETDGDDDYGSGTGWSWSWSWSYSITGIDCGGTSEGAWASAGFSADAGSDLGGDGPLAVDKSASTSASVSGSSSFEDRYPYDTGDLEYTWDVLASGTVMVAGDITTSNLGSGDSVGCASYSGADAGAEESGYGDIAGTVTESSTGYASKYVGGEATEDDSSISVTSITYYATLDFTVDAYDSDTVAGGQGNSFYASAGMSVSVGASAAVDISSGYSGATEGTADADFGGWAIVYVTLP